MKKTLYFDYAAATPLLPAAKEAMLPFFADEFYNPSGLSLESREVRLKLDDARKQVAMRVGCHASEIRFVAGGTEGNNIAVQGVLRQHPRSSLILSAVEHDSVRHIAEHYTHDIVRLISTVKSRLTAREENN